MSPHSAILPRGGRALAGPVLAWLACPFLAQAPRNPQEPRNLVLNGGFEAPPVEPEGIQEVVSAGAWTAEVGTIEVQNALGALVAYTGEQYLALNAFALVSQGCATVPQQRYSLSFAYSPQPGAAQVSFEVWFAGSLKETVVVPAGSPAVWSHKSYAVVGSTSRDELEFRCLSGSPLGVLIDDCFLIPYSPTSSGQLLRNGNFEDDPQLPAGGTIENPVYVGWSTGRHYDILMHDLGTAGNGYDGKNVMHLREKRAISQFVYAVPQQVYQLRFACSPNPADDRARTFTVSFAGQLLETITVPLSTTIAWTVRTYSVSSPRPLAAVEFKDLSDGAVGCLVDGVSLVGPVPEPETSGQIARYSVLQRGTILPLNPEAMFARGMTSLGDLDGNGVQDLAIGSVGDDDGADNAGAVWIAFMNANKTLKAAAKISELRGGLVADLQKDDGFGRALSCLGDLDGDGIPDLAVGANEDDTGDFNAGAVYVLFLTRQGTVRAQHKITALSRGDKLDYVPVFESNFGAALAGMGDVDGDGIPDLAVGSRFGDSVQVCFMRRDGTVRASRNITYGLNGFTDTVTSVSDFFGMSCANMGDFDRDGVNDLLVGAFGRRINFMNYVGGQYLMLLNRDGTVKRWFYYGTENMNTRTQTLGVNYNLGTSCVGLGDVDGDGVLDLATGAQREGAISGLEREQSTNKGAVYVLLLNANGTIKTCQRLGDQAGGFGSIANGTRWGESLAALGDWDGNGMLDVAIGSRFASNTGVVYFCELVGRTQAVLRADFSGTPLSGPAPLTVQFADLSTGPVSAWSWDFGDGTTSSQPAPSHAYAAGGTYSVRLTVSGSDGGSNSKLLTGLVNVSAGGGLPQGVVKLGCGVNPPTSFQLVSGVPRIGTVMTFAVDNPFGTQAVGSIPILVASWTPSPNSPCGTLQPGRGMSAPGAPGEFLFSNPIALTRRGNAWTGAGHPAPVALQIPTSSSFIGRTLYVQGRLQDSSSGAAIPLSYADGFALTLR